jgi:hypothetical protein
MTRRYYLPIVCLALALPAGALLAAPTPVGLNCCD